MVNHGLVVAATGHRPDKLGGYGERVASRLDSVASRYLKLHMPGLVVSGMALGWDQAVARAAVALGIPFVAALPFSGQSDRWPTDSRDKYDELLSKAARVDVVCPGGYSPWKMQRRNEWMVNQATRIMALWNGDQFGGTFNCIRYAWELEKQKPVDNLWDEYIKFVHD